MSHRLLTVSIVVALWAQHVSATPYWTPEQIADEFRSRGAATEGRFAMPADRHVRGALDDIAYFTHYRMLCDFLVSLQYTGVNANNGGMIEGESGNDHNIIQTDNTQEAIRVWSQYGIWTGDTARYGTNIRLAQGYCGRFPAWREEGGGYYATHNCGWGLEAVRKYREAYGDTSWNWYADSCAIWLVANPLAFDPNSTTLGQINPCAEGLGIGGMYPHAVERGRADWQNFALNQARLLRRWFESNPLRLYANETWALCGGTALWGICVSLFTHDPDSGRQWLTQYGPQLDTWESTGTWNHSFNTWYCNAQFEVFRITGDSTYWSNAVFICDSLIGLDWDNDGGIPPGRGYPVTNDHSWVSAYMGWMGMERIINSAPVRDVAARGFASPSLLPHLAGDTLRVAARVVNQGVVAMTAQAHVTGPFFSGLTDVVLEAGADTVIAFAQPWVLPDNESLPPLAALSLSLTVPLDENPANDTITVAFDIRRGCDVFGLIFGDDPPNTVPCRVEFYHEAYPDSPWTVTQSPAGQFFSNGPRRLMTGMNTIRVIPPLRYMIEEQTTELVANPVPLQVDFWLDRTVVALMDDDGGDSLERFLRSSLDSLDLPARWWDKAAWGEAEITGIPTVLWFTGSDSLTTLEADEQTVLADYVWGGGHLLLTGQNITDNLGPNSQFLREVLHCSSRTPNTGDRFVAGVAGNPISDGLTLYLIGTGGAWNQTSPASVWPLDGATEVLRYQSSGAEVCGVSSEYGSGRSVFLSFGLEAVSGASNTTTRHRFLDRCFAWFGDSLDTAEPIPPIVNGLVLEQNFPNPFNPVTDIRFSVPRGTAGLQLTIYDVLGREVCRLIDGTISEGTHVVRWNGTNNAGQPVASGAYVCRLHAGSASTARMLQLLR